MSKIFILLTAIIVVSCSKETPLRNPPTGDGSSNMPEVLRNLASEYAAKELDGISIAYQDTVSFSYRIIGALPDSTTYRKSVMDKTAVAAFRYTFKPVQDKPGTWKQFCFAFDLSFVQEDEEATIRFLYPLSLPLFFF